MPKIIKHILGIFLFLLSFAPNYAQSFEPIWINYGTDSGLPSSETYEILQDKKGYIWISTDNGLSRFDGYSFKNFGPKEGLRDPVVFCLREDETGDIWMNSLSGKIYIYSSDSIHPYKYNSIIEKFNTRPYDIPLFEVKNGAIYIALLRTGILNIDKFGNYKLLKHNSNASLDIARIDHKKLICMDGNINYDTREVDLVRFNEDKFISKTKYKFTINNQRWTPPNIFFLNDSIEIITNNYFIETYVNGTQVKRIYDPDLTLISIIQDKNGIIYTCNRNGKGIRVYKNINDFINEKFFSYLEGYNISFLSKDRNGGFWAASNNKGIFYSRDLNFEQLRNNAINVNDEITAISNIINNKFYIGYQSGNISLYDIENNSFKSIEFCNSYPVNDIFIDDKNAQIYITDQIGTFYLKNNKWNEIKRYIPDLKVFYNVPLRKFWYKNQTHDLIGTTERGFFKIDKLTNNPYYFSYTSTNQKIPAIRTLCAFKSKNGNQYIGTIKGLYEVKTDTFLRISNHNSNLELRVEAIDELKDSSLIVGTKGVGILILKNSNSINISEKEGLSSNMIENIYVDSKDNIWVGTLLGLNRIYKNGKVWKVDQYTIHNGLPSNEILSVKSANGIIWCLTNKGLIRIRHFNKEKSIVPIFISGFSINNIPVKISNNLVFKYNQNNIRLNIECLNFRMNGRIPYRFKLKHDEEWKETSERLISLYSLAPGKYNLQIQAKNEEGIWSASTYFPFSISPPWWQTWQFYLLIFALIAFIIGRMVTIRIRNLNRKIAIQRQINELEQSARKAQMNPHFLFNALNSIQSQIITGNLEEATHFLASFGHLVRGVLDMSIKTSISLASDIEYIQKYIELEQLRFKGRFKYEIFLAKDLNPSKVFIPPMLIQPFVENAIVHGINKIEKEGKIQLFFEIIESYLEIIIIDNGVGFQHKSSKDSLQKSVGISNTKRRLELLDELKSSDLLKMEENKDSTGSIIGTKVTLLIKL